MTAALIPASCEDEGIVDPCNLRNHSIDREIIPGALPPCCTHRSSTFRGKDEESQPSTKRHKIRGWNKVTGLAIVNDFRQAADRCRNHWQPFCHCLKSGHAEALLKRGHGEDVPASECWAKILLPAKKANAARQTQAPYFSFQVLTLGASSSDFQTQSGKLQA
jgi:hypothetical protein